jgi:hypothetical protein
MDNALGLCERLYSDALQPMRVICGRDDDCAQLAEGKQYCGL